MLQVRRQNDGLEAVPRCASCGGDIEETGFALLTLWEQPAAPDVELTHECTTCRETFAARHRGCAWTARTMFRASLLAAVAPARDAPPSKYARTTPAPPPPD